MKSKGEQTHAENVQPNVVTKHFWILDEFAILTDGDFNLFSVIPKLWFILPLFLVFMTSYLVMKKNSGYTQISVDKYFSQ